VSDPERHIARPDQGRRARLNQRLRQSFIEGAEVDMLVGVEDRQQRPADAQRERRTRLNQRLRQAFIAGAEADMRRLLGRGLTSDELERVLRRYPGDVRERREQQVVVLNCGEPDSGLPAVEEP
jgi:hypothetical protein